MCLKRHRRNFANLELAYFDSRLADCAETIVNVTRIFVVSAQDIFRMGVKCVVHNEPWLRVVGDEPNLADATESIQSSSPDLIILDLQNVDLMRDLTRLVRCSRIPSPKAIVVTAASTDFEIAQCIQAGVNGIICRNIQQGEMIIAIREVLEGRTHFCSHTNGRLARDIKNRSLTSRELEVLQLLAFGFSNKEIAKRLDIGVGTVKTHLININSKLKVTTRTEAVFHGVQQRLITI